MGFVPREKGIAWAAIQETPDSFEILALSSTEGPSYEPPTPLFLGRIHRLVRAEIRSHRPVAVAIEKHIVAPPETHQAWIEGALLAALGQAPKGTRLSEQFKECVQDRLKALEKPPKDPWLVRALTVAVLELEDLQAEAKE